MILLLLPLAALDAQSRGITVIGQGGAALTNFSQSYALVIGESNYTNGWARLAGVKEDVQVVTRLFEEQGFTVETLENADSANLRDGIEAFLNRYGYDEDTRLIVYYAGHGHTLKLSNTRDMGYIVPTDAPNPARDERGFQQKAIPMQMFDTWAKMITSRHVLFMFDSCFSGSVFAMSRAAPGIIDYKISQPVRQFIAAGAADETVPDKSIFRRQLEMALRGREADLNHDGYVSGSELGDFLQSSV
ncbi:MAG: caspase family protein, partial [Treponema sp.]|nr:caspase family protein [Treponema sp.]